MSHASVYRFDKAGKYAGEVGKAHNAMAGALTIWHSLSDKYGVEFPFRAENVPIWTMCNEGKLSEMDAICIRFTYDHVWVKRENIPRLVEALRYFHRAFVEGTGIVPTISALADILIAAHAEESTLGVGFRQTSVISNPWVDFDEETDTATPYDMATGTKHHELFDPEHLKFATPPTTSTPGDAPGREG